MWCSACVARTFARTFFRDYQSVLGVLGTRGDGLMRMEAKALHFDRSRRCPAADSSVDITGPDGPQREMTWGGCGVDEVPVHRRYCQHGQQEDREQENRGSPKH